MVICGEQWREEAQSLRIMRPQVWRPRKNGNKIMDVSQAIDALASADEIDLEAIDEEIACLQQRIDRLKRLRKVLLPAAPRAAANARIGDFESRIIAEVKEHGPLKPKQLGERIGIAYTIVGKVVAASQQLQRLTDGRIAHVS